MGQRYLVDSNVIIDFCNGKLIEKGRLFLQTIVPELSIITNIELFATQNISEQEHALLRKFVAFSTIHPVNVDLVNTTISIRRHYKVKLPDAIIAATAMTFDLTLLSRNVADFAKISGLKVIDPYNI